ncbi:hypothetical protein M9Y10_027642 [Tritrichomonas musculus]|uniref:Protein kinase domain-containing protein n=1 Tax=Tritrichomonas musculus TaxID=1915356 RepID=A0ABR2H3M0_9EUKA
MAPEIINDEEFYNEKVDFYSFGVVAFFVLNSREISSIKIGDIFKDKKIAMPESFSPLAKQLVSECLSIEAKDSPSFSEIVSRMEKNEYKMLPLERAQVAEIKNKSNQHKAKIPPYK